MRIVINENHLMAAILAVVISAGIALFVHAIRRDASVFSEATVISTWTETVGDSKAARWCTCAQLPNGWRTTFDGQLGNAGDVVVVQVRRCDLDPVEAKVAKPN